MNDFASGRMRFFSVFSILTVFISAGLAFLCGLGLVLMHDPARKAAWYSEAAAAYFVQASVSKQPEQSAEIYAQAQAAMGRALLINPYEPYYWLRYAEIIKIFRPSDTAHWRGAYLIAGDISPVFKPQIERRMESAGGETFSHAR